MAHKFSPLGALLFSIKRICFCLVFFKKIKICLAVNYYFGLPPVGGLCRESALWRFSSVEKQTPACNSTREREKAPITNKRRNVFLFFKQQATLSGRVDEPLHLIYDKRWAFSAIFFFSNSRCYARGREMDVVFKHEFSLVGMLWANIKCGLVFVWPTKIKCRTMEQKSRLNSHPP